MQEKLLINIVEELDEEMNRKRRTIINSVVGIIYKVTCMICPFIIRTIIIKILGDEYAGLSSLFTSIIGVKFS